MPKEWSSKPKGVKRGKEEVNGAEEAQRIKW